MSTQRQHRDARPAIAGALLAVTAGAFGGGPAPALGSPDTSPAEERGEPIVRTTIVSRQSKAAGGDLADAPVQGVDISDDGRYVVFATGAENLGGAASPVRQIYRYDTKKRRVILISRRGDRPGTGYSVGPSISRSGRFVAYTSVARNLPGPRGKNAYLYDVRRGRTILVSRGSETDGGNAANGTSVAQDISADGRTVSFRTIATNLGGPTAALRNVYVYDTDTREAELVSRQSEAAGGSGADKGSDGVAALSADGRFVTFESAGENLSGPPEGEFENQRSYLRDRQLGTTRLVSPDLGRKGYSSPTSISGNGDLVGLYAYRKGQGRSYLAGPDGSISRVDRRSGSGAFVSLNGRFVATVGEGGRAGVYRQDLRTGDGLSLPLDLPSPHDPLEAAAISADGRAIAYVGIERGSGEARVYLSRISRSR